MAESSKVRLKVPTADERRIAQENFERAKQVLATQNFDYAINLLRTCCQLDPGHFSYRVALRKAQKEKYGHNLRGSRLAFLSTPRLKAKMKAAKANRDNMAVLEYGEDVLSRNPWDLTASLDMAEAFEALGLLELAIFNLDQARQKYPKDATLNRALARLFEKRGDFKQAILLWQLIRETNPQDTEAAHKAKDLAASETIARGGYEEVAAGSRESPVVGRLEAQADAKKDKLSRTVEPLLQRLETNPTEPSLYLQLSQVYRQHQQDDRALAVLRQGLAATGQHISLQTELAELELIPLRKNLELAEARLNAAKAQPDDDFDAPSIDDLQAARDALAADVLKREVAWLRYKIDRSPNDMTLRLELGFKLLHAGLYDDAILELQQARKEEKLRGRASLGLGLCFAQRKNWRLAQRNYEEALTSLPATDETSRKEALYQLAVGSAAQNDYARAVDLGHELANLDFGYKNISGLLSSWETQTHQA